MSATIKVKGITATITDGVWKCKDEILSGLLISFVTEQHPYNNADYESAQEAVKQLGGEIVSYTNPENDPDVVY